MKVILPRTAKSEIPISLGSPKTAALVYIKQIETLGPSAVLQKLATERATMDTREQVWLRVHLKAAYSCATIMKQEPGLRRAFCDDPFWNDVPRPPKFEKPERLLFYTYVRLFGISPAGRSKASYYFKLDQQNFDSGLEQGHTSVDEFKINLKSKDFHCFILHPSDLSRLQFTAAADENLSVVVSVSALRTIQPLQKSLAFDLTKRRA